MFFEQQTDGTQKNFLPALLCTACLLSVQFVSFLEGRGLGTPPFSLPGVLLSNLSGLLLGGLLFSRLDKQYISPLIFCLSTAGALLWGEAILNNNALACYGACLLGATVFPPILEHLLRISRYPGLYLGIAFAIADFFWLFFYLLPAPPEPEFMELLFSCLQITGGILAALTLRSQKHSPLPESTVPEPVKIQGQRTTLLYLSLIALLLFTLNAFLDISFYRMYTEVIPIPGEVHLYIWIVYPLTGMYIDKYGSDVRLLLLCLAGNIFPISLIAIADGSLIYWCTYTLILASRAMAIMYLLLIFFKTSRHLPFKPLVISVPYLAMMAGFLGVSVFTQQYMGTDHIILWFFFLTASFSYLSSRVRHALTLAGADRNSSRPAPSEDRSSLPGPQEVPPSMEDKARNIALFSTRYGLSEREQDVLQLIVYGGNTTTICERLHISENTVKTHVRHLLRKTETSNRIALAALFFNETEKWQHHSPPSFLQDRPAAEAKPMVED